MATEEPPYLLVGTEVSAKYRGAFCEAKVKKVIKTVKCKISLKEGGSIIVQDDDIRGVLKVGRSVEVKHPETGIYAEGIVNKITDQSVYTVIFDDADENTLRRTQLCLKGEKHFVKSETLDDLPLTHPEHFGTPVMKGGKGYKRKRAAAMLDGSDSEMDETSSEDSRQIRRSYRGRLQDLVGRVLSVEMEDRKKAFWVPVLVVQVSADDMELKTKDHLLVKSFKDSKFYSVCRKDAKDFTREMALKNEDKAVKAAFEKALLYYDTRDLPMNWDREELIGSESDTEEESDSSDDEPNEEKDRFVAQLYKFMDDRGTPINKAPLIANRDLNLYRLFRLVQNLGGYNRVTNQMKWRVVHSKMNLPSTGNASNQIKAAYKKFLHAFEDFYRKLGSTMGTISRPSRSRHSSGRSLVSFRERERENSAPKSPGRASKKSKDSDSESDIEEKEEPKSESAISNRVKTRSKLEEKAKPNKEESDTESEADEKPVTRKGRTTRQTEEKKKEDHKEATPKPATRVTTAKLAAKEKEVVEDRRRLQKDDRLMEKKVAKKDMKEEETPSEKDEEDEESGKKMQTRKKSARLAADGNDKEDEKEEVENKHQDKKKKAEKTKEKEGKGEDEEEDDRFSENPDEYPLGTKLKVKYGKGKNQKLYEAKVLELEREGAVLHYKVHYAGWNNRYDEWVKKERIVGILSEPDSKKGKHRPPPKPFKKEKDRDLDPSKDDSSPAGRKRGRPHDADSKDGHDSPRGKGKTPTAGGAVSKANRPPTRSASVDNSQLAGGLPPKHRRTRRSSGVGTESVASRDSEQEDSEEEGVVMAGEKDESGEEESLGGPPSSIMDDTDTGSKVKSLSDGHISDGGPDLDSDEKDEDDLPDLANMSRKKEKIELKVLKDLKSDDDKDNKSDDSKMSKLTFDSDEDDEKDSEMEDRKLEIIKSLEEDDKSVKSVEKEEGCDFSDNVSQKGEADKETEKPKPKAKRKGKRKNSETEVPPAKVEEKIQEVPPIQEEVVPRLEEEVKTSQESIAENRLPKPQPTDAHKTEDCPKKKGKAAKKEKVVTAVESPAKSKVAKTEKKAKRKPDEEELKIVEGEEKSPKKKARRKKKEEEKVEDSITQSIEATVAASLSIEETKAEPEHKTQTHEPKPVEVSPVPKLSFPASPQFGPAPQLTEAGKVEPKPEADGPAPHLSPELATKTQSVRETKPAEPAPKTEAPLEQPPPEKPSASTSLFVNTPPETPEGSIEGQSPESGHSPSQEDACSTKSERDANLEVATLMGPSLPAPGAESPNTCDISTNSNASGSSSGNAPGSESEGVVVPPSSKRPKEDAEEEGEGDKPTGSKRRKRGHKKGDKHKRAMKNSMSDSDEASLADSATKSVSPTKSTGQSSLLSEEQPKRRTPKYNFVNMAEYQYLEGEERIKYLMGQITDLRKVYMNLKAEVACIDRRRKRHRRKERETKAEVASHTSSQDNVEASWQLLRLAGKGK